MNIYKFTHVILILAFMGFLPEIKAQTFKNQTVEDFIADHRIQEQVAKLEADRRVVLPGELRFKGQKRSLTKWGSLDVDKFLSWKNWKKERIDKDDNPEWETAARERNQSEMVGRIYQCVGRCKVDRGEGFFFGGHRTNLYEGDDIETEADSYLWIFLFDGTMIRLSPMSSLTLNEFNVGVKENFINARVNHGNVLWLSRSEEQYEESNHRETDVIFSPYANLETTPYEEVKEYDEENLFELISEPLVNLNQMKRLNSFITKNNKITENKKTYAFIILPNVTIMGYAPSLEIIHLLGDETHLKLRSKKMLFLKDSNEVLDDYDISLQLRGLENKKMHGIPEDQWITINAFGTSMRESEDVSRFSIGEFVTKRPTRILLGREVFLANYSKFVFKKDLEPLSFAREYGYRLWGFIDDKGSKSTEDLTLRIEFLKEYARRIETTNLKSKLAYHERLKLRGFPVDNMQYGDYFYTKAMDMYYIGGEIQRDTTTDEELTKKLNSTEKKIWKKMHGIR